MQTHTLGCPCYHTMAGRACLNRQNHTCKHTSTHLHTLDCPCYHTMAGRSHLTCTITPIHIIAHIVVVAGCSFLQAQSLSLKTCQLLPSITRTPVASRDEYARKQSTVWLSPSDAPATLPFKCASEYALLLFKVCVCVCVLLLAVCWCSAVGCLLV